MTDSDTKVLHALKKDLDGLAAIRAELKRKDERAAWWRRKATNARRLERRTYLDGMAAGINHAYTQLGYFVGISVEMPAAIEVDKEEDNAAD